MLYFLNDGLIDRRAMTTFGVSVKEGDNPIGFFGTGLKYAVAIILRLGGTITVYRGMQRYDFGVNFANIRGEKFNIVTLGNRELGFTTDVGKTWEPWQAFRELYCNTADEDGTVSDKETPPQKGKTLVVVDCKELQDAYNNKDSIFLQSGPMLVTPTAQIHNNPCNTIFYRGIRVGKFEHPTVFTYNIAAQVDLTEDRTVKHPFQVDAAIRRSVIKNLSCSLSINTSSYTSRKAEKSCQLLEPTVPSHRMWHETASINDANAP